MAHPVLDKLRAKYPGEYDAIPDAELAAKLVAKYPEYRESVADLLTTSAPKIGAEKKAGPSAHQVRMERMKREEQKAGSLGTRIKERYGRGVETAKAGFGQIAAHQEPGPAHVPIIGPVDVGPFNPTLKTALGGLGILGGSLTAALSPAIAPIGQAVEKTLKVPALKTAMTVANPLLAVAEAAGLGPEEIAAAAEEIVEMHVPVSPALKAGRGLVQAGRRLLPGAVHGTKAAKAAAEALPTLRTPPAGAGAIPEAVQPNPKPSPGLEAAVAQKAAAMGADPADPQSVANVLAKEAGIEPPKVTVAEAPVSQTVQEPGGAYRLDLEDARPSEVVHEMDHVKADHGIVPPVPEGGVQTAEAFAEAPLPKYAGNMNLNRMAAPDSIKRQIIKDAEVLGTPERISLDSIRRDADEAGFGIDDLSKFAKQTVEQRKKFVAARDLNQTIQVDYATKRKVYDADPSPQNYENLRVSQVNRLQVLDDTMQVAHEAGLALRIHGMEARAGKGIGVTEAHKVLNRLISTLKEKGKYSGQIERTLTLADLSDPRQVAGLVRKLSPSAASMEDKVFEWYVNSVLSGFPTYERMVLGNVGMLAMRPTVSLAGAVADLPMAPFRGRQKFFGEVAQDIQGMFESIGDGARMAIERLKTELPTDASKYETHGPAIGGVTGRVVRHATTIASAIDDFTSVMAMRGAARSKAYQIARREGRHGKDAADRFHALLDEPTPEMHDFMSKEARERSFRRELGSAGKKLMAFRDDKHLYGLGRFAATFLRMGMTAGKVGFEHTGPLNLVRLGAKAARGTLPKGAELSDELGKVIIGSATSAWVASEVLKGRISGYGPDDYKKREQLRALGWSPYSWRIGKNWIPYGYFEPFATMIGATADFVEHMDRADDVEVSTVIEGLGRAFAKNVTSKSWNRALAGLSDWMAGKQTSASAAIINVLGDTLSGFIPAAISNPIRAQDPYLRETYDITDRLRKRLGDQSLFPVRDVLGRPIEAPGTPWERWLSPFRRSAEDGDELEMMLLDAAVELPQISDTFQRKGQRIKLPPDKYDELQVRAGNEAQADLLKLKANPLYQTKWDAERKYKEVLRTVRLARDRAKDDFYDDLAKSDFMKEFLARAGEKTRALDRVQRGILARAVEAAAAEAAREVNRRGLTQP